MTPNPLLGVALHWLGGLAAASFYVPYRSVRQWSWEVFWLVGGLVSWIVAPWIFAAVQTNDLLGVLSATPASTLGLCFFFGLLWGFGGLTFGLSVRYLGLSLGYAIVLGLSATFGTIVPPLVSGELFNTLIHTRHGLIVLFGLLVCLFGIAVIGLAGRSKEKETGADESGLKEFNLRKGVLVALFSGVMSSCFAFGLAAGEPIRQLTLAAGSDPLWQGLPVLCVVLGGGAVTNLVWCLYLILRNKTGGEFVGKAAASKVVGGKTPIVRNYLLCALGGLAWYFQFFFYTMGESQMGEYGFSSWTLHMASIIIFSSLWGFALKEWKGAGRKTISLVFLGLAILISSTVIIGLGNALQS